MSWNKGDTFLIEFDYCIDGEPIYEGQCEEIELYLGKNRYTLTNGDIYWDEEEQIYCCLVDQPDTFELQCIRDNYQVRFKINSEVVSDDVKPIPIGRTISRTVI